MLDNLNEKLNEVVETAKDSLGNLTENVDLSNLSELKDKAQDALGDVVDKAKDVFEDLTKK